ncbi:acyltransferase [Winogradskyella aquimaris]|uniref:Acyltransferase n=1 Tax=Winogradskyella aquimaris TaxID=864074 RepID=A0ABU5EKY1_9FLAO|nr:acyltransferase [Winogradskyella aquimaris]MDY2587076.1 acyltransferase [Winogradskyella aquimaris]
MTGITILIVIYGHMLFDGNLPSWYIKSRLIIYRFHMPVFMFISGFIISYSYKPVNNLLEYWYMVKRKLLKFAPTYILLAIIFILLKILINGASSDQTRKDIYYAIFIPIQSPSGFLWYIYVLMQFYIIFPLLEWIANKNILLLIILGFAIHFIDVTSMFNLDLFAFYFIFVAFGIVANRYYNIFKTFFKKIGIIIISLIIILSCFNHMPSKLPFGILAIPSIYYLSLILAKYKIGTYLSFLGKNAYQMYIWHTLIMGFVYIFFTRILNLEVSIIILMIVFASGVIMPILIKKSIIERSHFLKNFFK